MSDMHKRPRWQNEALTKEVLSLRAQLKAARETILSYEDREASVCPEDVSFEQAIKSLRAQLDAVTKERDELLSTLDMNNRLLVEHLHSLEAGGRNTKLSRLNELNTERKNELCALKRQLNELRLTDTEHSTLCRAAGLLDSFDRKSVGDAVITIVKRLNSVDDKETP